MVKKFFVVSEADNILKNYHYYKSLCVNGESPEIVEKIKFLDNTIEVLPSELKNIVIGSFIEKIKITDLAKNMAYSRQSIYNKQKKAKEMIFLCFDKRFKSK